MERIEYPPHMPHRGVLVGPIEHFRNQPVAVDRSAPKDTTDPRWRNCTDHHLACDCREAEQNEMIGEQGAELAHLREVLTGMIRGHATEIFQYDGQPRRDLECQCLLCEFARKAHMVPFGNSRYAAHNQHVF